MMADSSQTRIFKKVDGQFVHGRWWLQSLILDVHTLLHFGQAKVWAEDDWDAALSVLPLASFLYGFMPLCLELTTGFSQL